MPAPTFRMPCILWGASHNMKFYPAFCGRNEILDMRYELFSRLTFTVFAWGIRSTTVENALQISSFMQNKPNSNPIKAKTKPIASKAKIDAMCGFIRLSETQLWFTGD